MKYCSHCGTELADEAVFCPKCGCQIGNISNSSSSTAISDTSGLDIAIEIFMVIGCVALSWTLISLCWTIPMTVHVFKCIKNKTSIGVGFKICTLLFCSLIGGILLLVRPED